MTPETPFVPIRWMVDTPDRADSLDVFPWLPGRQFIAPKSPIWSTKIATASSGRERRAQLWSYPRWLFKINHDFLRTTDPGSDEYKRLVEFFCDHAGQSVPFYFYDPTDNTVTNQIIGVGDGSQVAFQLKRAVRRWTEPVFVVSGPPRVCVNYVETPVTLIGNGVVTFSSPPSVGAVITWSGTFMFLCRFDQDQIDLQQDFSDVWSLANLSFRSIKPDAATLVMPSLNYSVQANSSKWLFLNAF